ncbi:MAG: hypothetical protein WC666_02570 [Candidatus Paceibacterota bacterium]|jgi:hypothetical protein
MKRNFYLLSLIAIVGLCIPLISKAQTTDNTTASAIASPSSSPVANPATNSTGVTSSINKPIPKPPVPKGISPSVRNTIRTDIENRVQNSKANDEARKNLIDERLGIASTSRNMIKDVRVEARGDIKMASSTQARQEIRKEMRRDIFDITRQKMVQQLELSMQNLKQVRDRVDSRIKKEKQNGKDMSKAITALVTADAKISAVKTAIQNFKDFNPKTLTTASSTTQTAGTPGQSVNLDSARQMMSLVQSAIKDAHRSLTDVVVAIAHAMGQKLGQSTATSTTE